MKTLIPLLLLLLLLPVAAQDEEIEYPDMDEIEEPTLDELVIDEPTVDGDSWLPELELGAYLHTSLRFLTEPPHSQTYNENQLGLKVKTVWDIADAQGELRLRGSGFSTATDIDNLTEGSRVDDWELELPNAWVNIYGVPLGFLDISIGKQTVGWGVGDKLRTFDAVNPGDYEDPLDFGRKLSVNMVKLTSWFSPTWRLETIFVPGFIPGRMPAERWQPPVEMELGDIAGVPLWLSSLTTPIRLPERKLSESAAYGARIKGGLGPVDLELAWLYGREDTPLATQVNTEVVVDFDAPAGTIPVAITAEGEFQQRHLFGFAAAADLFNVGLWGELSLTYYPNDIIQTQTSLLGDVEVLLYEEGSNLRWLGGIDYSFGGFYMQLQYLHGFYNQRVEEEMSDFFIYAVEKGFLYDKLKLRLAVGMEVPAASPFDENWGLALLPELAWMPVSGITLKLGGVWLEGDGSSLLAGMQTNDEVYLKLEAEL